MWTGIVLGAAGALAPVRQSVDAPALDKERARAQLAELAQLVSMNSELALEDLDIARVLRGIERARALRELEFDAHPELRTAGPVIVERVLSMESRVVTVLRARFEEAQSLRDLAFGLGVELLSRFYEDQVLRQWQLEFDEFCRVQWKPLAAVAAELAGPPTEARLVGLRTRGSGVATALQATNDSAAALHDVTLLATYCAIDGSKSQHRYYFSEWAQGEAVDLRVAADWWHVGAARTVRVELEVLAAEARLRKRAVTLTENVENALRTSLALAAAWRARGDDVNALTFVKVLLKECDAFPSVADECKRLRSELRRVVGDEQAEVKARKQQLELQRAALRDQIAVAEQKNQRAKQLELEERHKALQQSIAALVERLELLGAALD